MTLCLVDNKQSYSIIVITMVTVAITTIVETYGGSKELTNGLMAGIMAGTMATHIRTTCVQLHSTCKMSQTYIILLRGWAGRFYKSRVHVNVFTTIIH